MTASESGDGPPQNNTTRVTELMRAAILSGELRPATRLRAAAMATRFGASRSPVREAVLTLEREGLVEVIPNRGAVVRSFDPEDLVDLYELRCVLEPYAASRAATRIAPEPLQRLDTICEVTAGFRGSGPAAIKPLVDHNIEFHEIIVVAADSPRLSEAMKGAVGIPLVYRSVFWEAAGQRERAFAQHREIVAALHAADAKLAEAAMSVHLLHALGFLLRHIERTSDLR